jgi:conjugative transfer pilus assembly protein TraH
MHPLRLLSVAAAALALMNAALVPLANGVAKANVGDAMEGYFDDMGAAANVTGPTAYQGQSAGYYSMGNVFVRFPQKNLNVANLQLPSLKAGCGGIDIFTGSFSFISAAELVALLKAIANNALGFAFKLAIDTLCPECGKVMAELQTYAQMMNNYTMNSCEMAQGIVGGVWPRSERASQTICQAIGTKEGVFSDWARGRQRCADEAKTVSEGARGNPEYDDVNYGLPRNFTWSVLKRSPFFSVGGSITPEKRELAEYVMTLVGTIIFVPPTGDAPGDFRPFNGDTSSALVTALVDGTAGGPTVSILRCDAGEPEDACLNPTTQTLAIPASQGLRAQVIALIDEMTAAIKTDTPVSTDAQGLLQIASLPLYKMLAVNAAHSRGANMLDSDVMAEVVSIDILFFVLDALMTEVAKSRQEFQAADEETLRTWHAQFVAVRETLLQKQGNTAQRITAINSLMARTQHLEASLAANLSPGMSASVNWSMSARQRSVN